VDYKKLAKNILPLVGGADNISESITCHTRLRLTLKDYNIVKDAQVKSLDGVLATRTGADQYQIVVGDNVKALYAEFIQQLRKTQESSATSLTEAPTQPDAKKKRILTNPIQLFAETMSAIFTPLIITICGSGLMMGLQILFTVLGWIQENDPIHTLLGVLGNVAFYFLPFTVAVAAADRFNTNKYMSIVMVGVLMHPTWLTLAEAGVQDVRILGIIPIQLLSYSSAVIPPLLTVYALAKLEHLLKKIIPPSLNTVLVPAIELLALGPIALAFVGPLSTWLSQAVSTGYFALYEVGAIPASALFAACYPLIVLTGTHLTFVPLMLDSIAITGVDYIMPLMSVAHCALSAMALAVMLKTRNARFRGVAATGALITGVGLTEPALYGVGLPLRKPLIISCIAGGIGGSIYGIFNVSALSLGLSPLGSIPIYFTNTFIWWLIGGLVSAALSFIGVWLFGYRDGDEKRIPHYIEEKIDDTLIGEK